MRSSDVIDVDAIDVDAVDVDATPDQQSPLIVPIPSSPRRATAVPKPSNDRQPPSPLTGPLPQVTDIWGQIPDIHALFAHYNEKHFNSGLTNVYVEFSTRMTLCAGTCTYRGRAGGCRIALSEPLLKLRPSADLHSTLLHEMIHAHLFNVGISRDGPDGHGPLFLKLAERINAVEPSDIRVTPYHTFSSEVEHYRTHHWQCDRCSMLIKRAMNRPPGVYDIFWEKHLRNCGGSFDKIREPAKKEKPVPKRRAIAVNKKAVSEQKAIPKGVMLTFRIDEMLSGKPEASSSKTDCPVCGISVSKLALNDHLDKCLSDDFTNDVIEVEVTQISPTFNPGKQEHCFAKSATGNEKPCVTGLTDDDNRAPTFYGTAIAPTDFQTTSPTGGAISTEPGADRFDEEARKARLSKTLSQAQGEYQYSPTSLTCGATEGDDVMEKYMQFAINPRAFCTKQTQQLVDDLRRDDVANDLRPAKKAKLSLSQLLRPVLYGQLKLEEARVKKSALQSLKLSSNDDSVGELSFVEVARRLGVPHTHVYRTLREQCRVDGDGSLVFPNNFEDVILSAKRKPRCSSFDRMVDVSDLKIGKNGVDSAGHGQENGLQTGECPVCAIKVSRSQLEAHVNECLDRSNLGRTVHGQASGGHGGVHSVADGMVDGIAVESAPVNRANCPICDSIIPRPELEEHVNSCLMSAGLDDAF